MLEIIIIILVGYLLICLAGSILVVLLALVLFYAFSFCIVSNILLHGLENLSNFRDYYLGILDWVLAHESFEEVPILGTIMTSNIVMIFYIVFALYIALVNIIVLVSSVKNIIVNTKEYYKYKNTAKLSRYSRANPNEKYECIAGFSNFFDITSDLFEICKENCSATASLKIVPKILFEILLVISPFSTVAYIFILPKIFRVALSFVFFLIESCLAFLIYVSREILLFSLKGYNKSISKKINYRCIYCGEQFNKPLYQCDCGRMHLNIGPSEFGLLKRTCTCGKKINTFKNNKNIFFICPFCKNKFNSISYSNESLNLSNEPYKCSTILLITDDTKKNFQFVFEKKLMECISKVDTFNLDANEFNFMQNYVEYQHKFKVNAPIRLIVSNKKLRYKRDVQIYRYSSNNNNIYNYYTYLDSAILVVDAQSILNQDIINYNNIISNFLVQLNMVSNSKNKKNIKLFILIKDNDSLLSIDADNLTQKQIHSKIKDILIQNNCLSFLNILNTNFKNYFLCYYTNYINKSLICDMVFCNDNKIKKIVKH